MMGQLEIGRQRPIDDAAGVLDRSLCIVERDIVVKYQANVENARPFAASRYADEAIFFDAANAKRFLTRIASSASTAA